MAENELSIIPIAKSDSYFLKRFLKKPMQNKHFWYGVKIKNIGESPIGKFRIKNIVLRWIKDQSGVDSIRSFDVNLLNPGETKLIWFEKVNCSQSGEAQIHIKMEGVNIKAYHYDFVSIKNEFLAENEWWGNFQTLDEYTYHQKNMNWILVVLTCFMAATPIVTFIKFLASLF